MTKRIKLVGEPSPLGLGGTKPVRIEDSDGVYWVCKYLGNPQGPKSLLNEFLAGRLASYLGVPWPEVQIGELGEGVLNRILKLGHKVSGKTCVCIQYVPDINEVKLPIGGFNDMSSFPERNRKHIQALFPEHKLKRFWGKAVLDDWVSMNDCKYDTLKMDKCGDPIFLDGSMALGGREWERLGNEWLGRRTLLLKSPYLKGVIDNSIGFRPWIESLENFTPSDAAEIFGQIPASWKIEESQLKNAESHFSQTREIFVPALKAGIERSMNYGWA